MVHLLIHMVIVIVVALTTFKVSQIKDMGVIRASSSVTLAFCFFIFVISNFVKIPIEDFYKLIFGASFVGMCSSIYFNEKHIIISSILFSVLFKYLAPNLFGLGGTLGFLAFLSVLVNYFWVREA